MRELLRQAPAVMRKQVAQAQTLTEFTQSGPGSMWEYLDNKEADLLEQLRSLRVRLSENEEWLTEARRQFERMLPEFPEKWREVERRARIAPVPHSYATANNVEAMLMAYVYVFSPLSGKFDSVPDDRQQSAAQAASTMASHLTDKTPSVKRIFTKISQAFRNHRREALSDGDWVVLQAFAHRWIASNFAKLEVGHKLAAALALTDVPDDVEVKSPWDAWGLVVPPGLLEDGDSSVARVWCEGSEPKFFVTGDGDLIGPLTQSILAADTPHKEGRAVALALASLVRGCCLALSNPDDYKRDSVGAAKSKGASQRSGGAPDLRSARFILSAPVTIDLRQHLREHIAGRKHGGGSPGVQFMVRGHWRNQSHGPRHSLRKTIWVQPFWKGDESSRVLLRNYKIKEGDES